MQARWLVPLLSTSEGRQWFLTKLEVPCPRHEADTATVFHLCFPLRDIFTADYYQSLDHRDSQRQLVADYNRLFGLPEDFGLDDVWRKKPGSDIRHPGASGRAGWSEAFLEKHVSGPSLRKKARDARRMLGTEADVLLIMERDLILVECKYLSELSLDQYGRHLMMGETLANRLTKQFHFGLVVKDDRDPLRVQIDEPYVTWSEIEVQVGGRA